MNQMPFIITTAWLTSTARSARLLPRRSWKWTARNDPVETCRIKLWLLHRLIPSFVVRLDHWVMLGRHRRWFEERFTNGPLAIPGDSVALLKLPDSILATSSFRRKSRRISCNMGDCVELCGKTLERFAVCNDNESFVIQDACIK